MPECFRPLPDPVVLAEALVEVAEFLRTQKRAAFAITCDYARESLNVLIALDDDGYQISRRVNADRPR